MLHTFDGSTYVPDRDGQRLNSQYKRVMAFIGDNEWHTLREIAIAAQGSEAAVSARLRDARKARFGSHVVSRKYIGNGLWAYRLEK